MEEATRIVVADEHEIVREGLTNKFKECGYDVVGQADDGYATIKACRTLRPDILVLGLSIVRPCGVVTLAKVRAVDSDIKVVVIASESCATDAFSVLADGAVAFVPREARVVDIVNAVRSAELNYTCVPRKYFSQFTSLRRNVARTGNMYGLSPRELEVYEACASGARTKEVAQLLSISVRTVEAHRNAIYRKTDCKNVRELGNIASML